MLKRTNDGSALFGTEQQTRQRHFKAVSNTKACQHLTYPMSIARKNSRVRGEILEVEKPSRQPEQGSQSGKGEDGQVIMVQAYEFKSSLVQVGRNLSLKTFYNAYHGKET